MVITACAVGSVSEWASRIRRRVVGDAAHQCGQRSGVRRQTGDVRLHHADGRAVPYAGGRFWWLTVVGGSDILVVDLPVSREEAALWTR
jgi:hypothetical protein